MEDELLVRRLDGLTDAQEEAQRVFDRELVVAAVIVDGLQPPRVH